ncbi:hypothetical protein K1719_022068 [Acacia pycnantha]|nr:hypothetical protein K1719_022068 [Acacia pycnantha]
MNCPLVPPSKEDDELLRRSSKKIKNFEGIMVYTSAWPLLGETKNLFKKGVSFAEKLKGTTRTGENSDDEDTRGQECGSEDIMSDDDLESEDTVPLCEIEEDLERNFPTFKFSEKTKKRLFRAWRKVVIIKLLDKTIGYKALLSRLQPWWAKKGVINLINIGNGYFVVKFTNREDFLNALTGGSWMIYDHYLTMRPWVPNFIPTKAKVDKSLSSEKMDSQPEKVLTDHRDQWKVVQKQRRQRKPKDDKEALSKHNAGGSTFEILAETEDIRHAALESVTVLQNVVE